ncbi:MAG TPA: hypothetical protein VG319_06945 [Polyangia bacterium]|nr:hypothetical protein [Polyangia bacterium]
MDYLVEVRYAGVVVGRGALVKDLGPESAFVGIPEPLPVGTPVTLKIGDVVREAHVDDVVESSDATAVGMRVRWGGAAETSRSAPAMQPAAPVATVEQPAQAAAPAERAHASTAPALSVEAPTPVQPASVVADSGPVAARLGADVPPGGSGPTPAVAAGDGRIAAPLSLAGPGGDGSHAGGKRRRKRR